MVYITSEYFQTMRPRQRSVASIEENPENPLGSLHFSVEFNLETCLLTVYLIEAENIVAREFSGTADPYCKVRLLPDTRTQLQSKIHRKTTDPIFDEEFIFEVDPDNVSGATLELLLFDYDQFSRHECIGQILLPLEDINVNMRQTYWKPIKTASKHIHEDVSTSLVTIMAEMYSLEENKRKYKCSHNCFIKRSSNMRFLSEFSRC